MCTRHREAKKFLRTVRDKHDRLQQFPNFVTFYAHEVKTVFVFDGDFTDWTDEALRYHIQTRLLAMHEKD